MGHRHAGLYLSFTLKQFDVVVGRLQVELRVVRVDTGLLRVYPALIHDYVSFVALVLVKSIVVFFFVARASVLLAKDVRCIHWDYRLIVELSILLGIGMMQLVVLDVSS